MLVKKALNTTIEVPNQLDSVAKAMEQMERLETSVLPVVDKTTNNLVGQIRHKTLEKAPHAYGLIKDLSIEEPIKVFAYQHLFHAILWMLQYEISLLPAVDDEWKYQGVLVRHQMLEILGQMLNLAEYGSIITIRLEQYDFSLTEIVHIIEAEEGKILGITVEPPDAEQHVYEVSIKINLQDVSRVASALRRHGYLILTEADNEQAHVDLETRADALINYLDI